MAVLAKDWRHIDVPIELASMSGGAIAKKGTLSPSRRRGRGRHVSQEGSIGVSPLLPYPQVAIQTRIAATSALLRLFLPSTTTHEPDQTALATEMVAIFSAWSALDTQRSLWHGGVLTAVTARSSTPTLP